MLIQVWKIFKSLDNKIITESTFHMPSQIKVWYSIHIDVKTPEIILTWINTIRHICVRSVLVLKTKLGDRRILILPRCCASSSHRISFPSVGRSALNDWHGGRGGGGNGGVAILLIGGGGIILFCMSGNAWFEDHFDTQINIQWFATQINIPRFAYKTCKRQTWAFISCHRSKLRLRLKT